MTKHRKRSGAKHL